MPQPQNSFAKRGSNIKSFLADGTVYNAEQYQFDLDLHLLHTPPDQSVTVVNGIELITETVDTEFKPLHGYAGWALQAEY